LFLNFVLTSVAQSHCGYDFTSYFVVNVHENGKTENIKNLKITIVDSLGVDVINTGNKFSWTNKDKPLQFIKNYKINTKGEKVLENTTDESAKWFYYFAKDYYLLSVANTFIAEQFYVKIEDIDAYENGGKFKTQLVQLNSYDMYVLCTTEAQNQAIKFGRRTNKPIDVVLELE